MQPKQLPEWASTLAKFLGYFLVLLALSMPSGFNTKLLTSLDGLGTVSCFYPTNSARYLISIFKDMDPACYARTAIKIASGDFNDSEVHAFFGHVAPGLSLIDATFLKIFGLDCPIIFLLILLNCVVWSLVLLNLYEVLKPRMGRIVSYFAPLLLCLSGVFQSYILQAGMVMSESLSIGLFALAVLSLIRAVAEPRLSLAVWSGSLLALAAYVRAQSEIVAMVLTFITLIAFCWQFFLFYRAFPQRFKFNAKFLQNQWQTLVDENFALSAIFLVVLSFNFFTVPYRIWKLTAGGYHSASWLQVDYIWRMGWKAEPLLAQTAWGRVWIDMGGTVPAHVDPTLAARIQADVKLHGDQSLSDGFFKWRTLTTFLRHPIEWMRLKSGFWPKYWFEPNFCHVMSHRPLIFCLWEDIIYILLVFFCVVRFIVIPCLQRSINRDDAAYFFYYAALLVSEAALFIYSHFEERYFYMLKLTTLVMFLAFLFQRTKPKTTI